MIRQNDSAKEAGLSASVRYYWSPGRRILRKCCQAPCTTSNVINRILSTIASPAEVSAAGTWGNPTRKHWERLSKGQEWYKSHCKGLRAPFCPPRSSLAALRAGREIFLLCKTPVCNACVVSGSIRSVLKKSSPLPQNKIAVFIKRNPSLVLASGNQNDSFGGEMVLEGGRGQKFLFTLRKKFFKGKAIGESCCLSSPTSRRSRSWTL